MMAQKLKALYLELSQKFSRNSEEFGKLQGDCPW